ncbi:50S ribosomal protein L32 [Candidatus Hodgkinia cicadicola]|uniref:50S ribosomal protein L32 n=1 Tax=Candidatus Hodgkinia cicadicola TaxID=573658 RepID=A0ABX4MEV4_9HYPH|nr:50S ribosomal protein L32 [Candidatus Hodgkinia cicadicola]PIM96432.1 50S ribosomal protein L32 [Candidatus Hodgkinia cicadicola]
MATPKKRTSLSKRKVRLWSKFLPNPLPSQSKSKLTYIKQ